MNRIFWFGFLLGLLGWKNSCASGFIENKGQWPSHVLYSIGVDNAQIFIEKGGYRVHVFDLRGLHHAQGDFVPQPNDVRFKGHVFQVNWVSPNFSAKALPQHPLPTRFNYFLGNQSEHWAQACQSYQEVILFDLFPGVDLRWMIEDGQVKTEWHIKPGAEASAIGWEYKGVDDCTLLKNQLILETAVGQWRERMPKAWSINSKNAKTNQTHHTHWVKEGKTIHWKIDRNNDEKWVIDPQLIFSTFSGSTSDNFGYTATYDQEGYLYSGSSAFGQGYPTTLGAYQTTWGGGDGSFTLPGTDIALSKYDVSGTYMVWSTFIGGVGDELPHSLVVNANNELIMYGSSGSNNFPCSNNALDNSFNGGTAFTPQGVGTTYPNGCDMVLTQLNASGSSLIMSTYYGGSGNDGVNTAGGLKFNYADEFRGEIDLDETGNIYVVGTTQSADFPVINSNAMAGGMQDVFVLKFNNDWQVQYAQKWGGAEDESGCSVAIKDGEVWLCGGTQSLNLPVSNNAYQSNFGGGSSDGWVAHLSSNGQWLEASYWGSAAYEQWYFIEVAGNGNPFIYGQSTANGNTWVINSDWFQTNSGMVVSQWNPDLSGLIRSTVFGSGSGVPNLSPAAFLVDVCGQIYLSGWGGAVNQGSNAQTGNTQNLWISNDAFQSTTNGSDFYLLLLADDFSAPIYGTYYGGGVSAEHVDGGTSRFDRKGVIYQSVCAGCGNHDDFPIFPPNAVSPINASNNCNNGVFKFDFELPLTYVQPLFPYEACVGETISFDANFQNVAGWIWIDQDGTVLGNAASFEFTFETPGDYYIAAIGIDSSTCNITDSAGHWISVHGPLVVSQEATVMCWGDSVWVGLDSAQANIQYHWIGDNIGVDSLYQTVYYGNTNTELILTAQGQWCTDTLKFPILVLHVEISLPQDTALCQGQPIAIAPEVLNGQNQITWYWNSLNGPSVGSNPILNWDLQQSGTFYAIAENQICQAMDSVHWEVLTFDSDVMDDIAVCGGDTLWIGISNPIPALDYVWTSSDQILSNLNAAQVEVQVTESEVFYVTSSLADCSRLDSIQVLVSSLSQSPLTLGLSQNVILSGQSVNLLIQPDQFDLSVLPANWVVQQSQGMVEGIPSESGWWNVEWIDGQCLRTDSIWIEVVDFDCTDPYLFIPNAFSPNQDGKNDVLYVYGHFDHDFQWQVNDRWGNAVFYSENPSLGWDGKYQGQWANAGVYHYYLKWKCADGSVWNKEGNISLIK